jgi:hypothetical protein
MVKSGRNAMPEQLWGDTRTWRRRQLVPALVALVLVAAVGLGGNVRTLMWVSGLHPTAEDVALHDFQQVVLGNLQHHNLPAAALAHRPAFPGVYSGAGFSGEAPAGAEIVLLETSLLLALALLWRQRPAPGRARPGFYLSPPKRPPRPLSSPAAA